MCCYTQWRQNVKIGFISVYSIAQFKFIVQSTPKEEHDKVVKFEFHGQSTELKHDSVVITAITSCTSTSNPSVLLGGGLVAMKSCELH